MSDLPKVGEIVIVNTRHHAGEKALVVEVPPATWRNQPRRHGGYARQFVRLQSVAGSLYGAQGWYEPHEFTRGAAR